jgi:hypothetical protein
MTLKNLNINNKPGAGNCSIKTIEIMETFYFKDVEIAHFSAGGKCMQMDLQMFWGEVTQPTTKRFEKYNFAKADDACVYLFNYVKKHNGFKKLALVAAYKIGSTNYMIDGKVIENRLSIPFAINNKQSIIEQLNFKKNAIK